MKSYKKSTSSNKQRNRLVWLSLLILTLVVIYSGSRSFSLVNQDNSLNSSPEVKNTPETETAEANTNTEPAEPQNELELARPASGTQLFAPQRSTVADQIRTWTQDQTNQEEIELLQVLAATPTGIWLSGPDAIDTTRLSQHVDDAISAGTLPIFVFYNIPSLGCTSGGASSTADYKAWIDTILEETKRLDSYIAIVEPDAIPMIGCLTDSDANERLISLGYAIDELAKQNTFTYLDSGHANWVSPADTASTISMVPTNNEFGLSYNVSNYQTSDQSEAFAKDVNSNLDNNKPYVIDTSRNGLGPDAVNEWCNSPGRSIGTKSEIINSGDLVGYLWIKVPGESDGQCNGGPSEGLWWADYALDLVRNSPQ